MLDITVLCSVVDNYGDIGFVYRLCRRLSEICSDIKLRVVIDNLQSFAFMNSKIDASLSEQEFNGWKILDWNDSELCKKEFLRNQPEFILQCFQCGRPEWLDEILFSEELKNTAYILDVEYLTAEKWADDFHLMRSGTRSVKVKKSIFMPGFTNKTGGLVLDENFKRCIEDRKYALKKISEALDVQQQSILWDESVFKILVFSYPRNFDFLVDALNSFSDSGNIKTHVFLARGISTEPFVQSCKNRNLNFSYSLLPSLEQEQWDALLCSMDFNFIRGEDSFSRAALSGIPFVWHAYIQDEEFQIVKVSAFIERLKPFFDEEYLNLYRRFSFLYNRDFKIEPGDEACQQLYRIEKLPETEEQIRSEMSSLLEKLLSDCKKSSVEFKKAAESFVDNGDLAAHLLDFIKSVSL